MRILFPLVVMSAVAAPVASPAADSNMPVRKPGWWEMKVTVAGPTAQPVHQIVHICTDAAVDRVQTPFGIHAGKECPPVQAKQTASGWDFSESCVLGKMHILTQGHANGDFASKYQAHVITRISPPPTPRAAKVETSIIATWLGACPAGKKPGEIEMRMDTNVLPNRQ